MPMGVPANKPMFATVLPTASTDATDAYISAFLTSYYMPTNRVIFKHIAKIIHGFEYNKFILVFI